MKKPTVLFVCTHNSVRSQMAEGLLRTRYGDHYTVFSAGTEPSSVNPLAIEAMDEIGINISDHRSESVDAYADRPIDYVVTVCDSAQESCPYLPARRQSLHQRFEDPSAVAGNDAEKRAAFRAARDAIAAWVEATFGPESPILDQHVE